MREIRLYGSEGEGAARSPYPYRIPPANAAQKEQMARTDRAVRRIFLETPEADSLRESGLCSQYGEGCCLEQDSPGTTLRLGELGFLCFVCHADAGVYFNASIRQSRSGLLRGGLQACASL